MVWQVNFCNRVFSWVCWWHGSHLTSYSFRSVEYFHNHIVCFVTNFLLKQWHIHYFVERQGFFYIFFPDISELFYLFTNCWWYYRINVSHFVLIEFIYYFSEFFFWDFINIVYIKIKLKCTYFSFTLGKLNLDHSLKCSLTLYMVWKNSIPHLYFLTSYWESMEKMLSNIFSVKIVISKLPGQQHGTSSWKCFSTIINI